MKFLVESNKVMNEAYGQSSELDDFVYNGFNRFNTFNYVKLKLDTGDSKYYYFRDEISAQEFYDKIKKESEDDKVYYSNAELSRGSVQVKFDASEDYFEYLAEDDE